MNVKNLLNLAFCAVSAAVLSSCCTSNLKYDDGPKQPKTTLKAFYTQEKITVDGKLDEKIWQMAPKYNMYRPISDSFRYSKQTRDAFKGDIVEPGFAQYAWDDNFLYVAVTFTDSDLHAEGMEDQLHHYKMGDVVEIFLKPEEKPSTGKSTAHRATSARHSVSWRAPSADWAAHIPKNARWRNSQSARRWMARWTSPGTRTRAGHAKSKSRWTRSA